MSIVPFSYFTIPSEEDTDSKNKTRYYYVNNNVISISQFTEKGIGGLLWDCVHILSHYYSRCLCWSILNHTLK